MVLVRVIDGEIRKKMKIRFYVDWARIIKSSELEGLYA